MKQSTITLLVVVGAALLGAVAFLSQQDLVSEASSEKPIIEPAKIVNNYYPLQKAKQSYRKIKNPEAVVPVQCYTKTEGRSNPCWACHTQERFPNMRGDFDLQWEYSFSDLGKTNQWFNLFKDRSLQIAAIADQEALHYVKQDNYSKLRNYLRKLDRSKYVGYRPDLDFTLGFDSQGFAKDGSHWRAYRYKPFLGAFWPTNGSTDDVMIRLPAKFRQKAQKESLAVYKANLALLEASFAADPEKKDAQIVWPIEAIDEKTVGLDLDKDGQLSVATVLKGLPKNYLGDAQDHPLRRSIYPQETEFLHSVRYPDPDQESQISQRMKELRYMRKVREVDDHRILAAYAHEDEEKDEGALPQFGGHPLSGLNNEFGWRLQGFIEDQNGDLRAQTHQEHIFCMGCHSNLGVTLDQSFSFARKLPGKAGWGYQNLAGIPDAPQLGHNKPEILTYFERVYGGDELRANQEILERFFEGGKVIEPEVRKASIKGSEDIRYLLAPSRERALQLIKAYMVLVKEQSFEDGRDVVLSPPENVHPKIKNESTGLREAGATALDGTLRLDWRGSKYFLEELSR